MRLWERDAVPTLALSQNSTPGLSASFMTLGRLAEMSCSVLSDNPPRGYRICGETNAPSVSAHTSGSRHLTARTLCTRIFLKGSSNFEPHLDECVVCVCVRVLCVCVSMFVCLPVYV